MDFSTIIEIYLSTVVLSQCINLYAICKMIKDISKSNKMINPNFPNMELVKNVAYKYDLNRIGLLGYFIPFVNVLSAFDFFSNYKLHGQDFLCELYSLGFTEDISYYAKSEYNKEPNSFTALKTIKKIKKAKVIKLLDSEFYINIRPDKYVEILKVTGTAKKYTPEVQRKIVNKIIDNNKNIIYGKNILINNNLCDILKLDKNINERDINLNISKGTIAFVYTDNIILFNFIDGDVSIVDENNSDDKYKIVCSTINEIVKEYIKFKQNNSTYDVSKSQIIKSINNNIIDIKHPCTSFLPKNIPSRNDFGYEEGLEPVSITRKRTLK